MPQLQPAGVFGRLFSSIFPKKLEVQVRSEELSDGRIALTPVYLLAGQEVDPALISLDSRQRILGHSVIAGKSVLTAYRQGTTRLPKHKAAEYLGDLKRKGVPVQGKTGEKLTEVQEVKPRVMLTLNPGDDLDVYSELITDQGVVVAKPLDLGQLRRDEGWFFADGDLLHVTTTNSDWDDILFTGEATNRLTGVSVPEFLTALGTFNGALGHVEKNDTLRDLAVYGKSRENRVTVDGDANSIRVSTRLVYYGKDRHQHELTPGDLTAIQKNQGAYQRIPEGWIYIDPSHVETFRQAHRELCARLGGFDGIEGSRIPETLQKLLGKKGFNSSWEVHLSEAVRNAHRISDEPAEVEFQIEAVENQGRSILEIVPAYDHDGVQLRMPIT